MRGANSAGRMNRVSAVAGDDRPPPRGQPRDTLPVGRTPAVAGPTPVGDRDHAVLAPTLAKAKAALAGVDLNADLGESYGRWALGDDDAMLAVVSSANIACGFHAGDPATLLRTVRAAAARGVAIGAQVSYPDLAGFGRRFIDMAPEDLTAAVLYQIGALDGLCRSVGTAVRYVKPHGALYNAVARHQEQAAAIVEAVLAYDDTLPVLGLPGSELLGKAARAGLRAVPEAFADRGYAADGTLLPRETPGALLDDPVVVAERVIQLVTENSVRCADGSVVRVEAASVCLHGDSPGAVTMARAVRERLAAAGVAVRPFAGGPR